MCRFEQKLTGRRDDHLECSHGGSGFVALYDEMMDRIYRIEILNACAHAGIWIQQPGRLL